MTDSRNLGRPDINPAVFITVFMVITIISNFMPVRVYGEIEFSFGMLKSLLVIGLIIAGLVVDVGGGPTHDVSIISCRCFYTHTQILLFLSILVAEIGDLNPSKSSSSKDLQAASWRSGAL